ncbi:MAG: ATP-binding protein [Carboxydocellales bacterium]
MKPLHSLITDNEIWLTKRVLDYLKQRRFTEYTSTLEEAWRVSIAELSKSLLERLNHRNEIPELAPEEDYFSDDFSEFGIIEAKKHRNRGVNPCLFIASLKYYKQAYLDLIISEKYERGYEEYCRLFIERCFDRIELGIITELINTNDQELISQLEANNRVLTNEKNKYLTIFESNQNPMVLFDTEHRVVNYNYAAAQIFQENPLPGANCYGPKQEIDVSWLLEEVETFASSKHIEHHFEKIIENIDRIHFFEVDLMQMLDISDKFKGTIAIINDITERERLRQEMERLDRLDLIGETAAGIGHEVRNPLTTVRGFLQIIQQKNAGIKGMEYLELMITELDQANSIISTFLSLAKNKYVALNKQSLNSLIHDILPLIETSSIMQDVIIVKDLNDIPDLLIDEKEITQLILNLVHNGLEAMSLGGTLHIRTYSEGDIVVLSVLDEGPGIAPELLAKIGTPFFTTKPFGTGLGLAVCYSIANRHNASIEIKTGSEGSTFNVLFKSNKG